MLSEYDFERFNDDRKIKIDVIHRKNYKELKLVRGNFRVNQSYMAKGKVLEKSILFFEIKECRRIRSWNNIPCSAEQVTIF